MLIILQAMEGLRGGCRLGDCNIERLKEEPDGQFDVASRCSIALSEKNTFDDKVSGSVRLS